MRVILFLTFFTLISCKNNEHTQNPKVDFEFYPLIPDTASYKKTFLKEKSDENKIFNLPDLFYGSKDSLEIRIWPWVAFDWFKNGLIFKFDGSNWVGYHYNSYTLPLIDQDGNKMIFTDLKKIGDSVFLVKQIYPICGWQKFSDSLEHFKIRTLPTQEQIKDFEQKGIRDGDAVMLEIATIKSYRRLYYSNPSSYLYEECKSIDGFMQMLRRQFGNDLTWPKKWLQSNKIN